MASDYRINMSLEYLKYVIDLQNKLKFLSKLKKNEPQLFNKFKDSINLLAKEFEPVEPDNDQEIAEIPF